MVLVWRITDDLPNSPNFPPTKLSRYTVLRKATKLMLLHKTTHRTTENYTNHATQSHNSWYTKLRTELCAHTLHTSYIGHAIYNYFCTYFL